MVEKGEGKRDEKRRGIADEGATWIERQKGKEYERELGEGKTGGGKMSERTESRAGDESERGYEFIEVEDGKRKKGRREGAADAPRQG